MTAPASPKKYTPDDLLALEDSAGYELLDGRLVERAASRRSSLVGTEFVRVIANFVVGANAGLVFGADLGMRIFADDPNRVRRADAVFLRKERVPPGDSGYLDIPADLIVEVVSPNDILDKVRSKVDQWLGAGVPMVWLAIPRSREIHVYRSDSKPAILTADDVLTGGDVLPEFSSPVAAFFPEPAARAD